MSGPATDHATLLAEWWDACAELERTWDEVQMARASIAPIEAAFTEASVRKHRAERALENANPTKAAG